MVKSKTSAMGSTGDPGDTIRIPRAEWEALRERIEDLEDALVVERFRREHGTGADAFIPAEIANRLLGGEPALRVWRSHRGLTQEALAAASGVSRAMIADIETERKHGSFETIIALAAALEVKPTDLMPGF